MVPNKIHVRGLDNLTTADIKAFTSEHFATEELVRVEWIDDTSANIVYESTEASIQALLSLTDFYVADSNTLSPSRLRQAKLFSAQPKVQLHIRQAMLTDVKMPRARDASRFYLMNPDKDPRECRKHTDSRHSGRGEYENRRYKRPRDDEKDVPFDVNMYDDDPGSVAAREISGRKKLECRSSFMSDDNNDRIKRMRFGSGFGVDLFSVRLSQNKDARLRDRSASPNRNNDGDGRFGFEDIGSRPKSVRQKSLTPPVVRNPTSTRDNAGKELLGSVQSRPSGVVPQSSISAMNGIKLSSNKSSPSKPGSRELFPPKGSAHRRTDAFDAADEVADIKSRNSADRIPGGPNRRRDKQSTLVVDMEDGEELEGFTIRGTAEQSSGFSIRGAARVGGVNPLIKELFPDKGEDNSGKELFGGNFKVRSERPRRKAEDMFF